MRKSSSCGLDLHDQSAKGRLRNGQKVVILEENTWKKLKNYQKKMPTRPVGPNFWTMSCCIFAISLSADCLTDDSKSQSTPCSHLFARFESHRWSMFRLYSLILLVDPWFNHFESLTVFHFIILHSTLSWPLPAAPHACDIAFRFAVLPHTTLPQQKFMCWVWRAEKLHPSKRKQLRYKSWEVETLNHHIPQIISSATLFWKWKNPPTFDWRKFRTHPTMM